MISNESQLEEKIGIPFTNKNLLHQALVHRSYLNEVKDEHESNERLEFLGDAVLELVVSEHIFRHFEKQDEGHLTVLRSRLVNTTSLFETAIVLGLGEVLYMSRGEETSGGRENKTLLANAVEALIGAIYIDSSVGKAQEFIQKFILSKIPETVKKSLKDPKSLLQEFVQAKGYSTPIYKTISSSGPDHAKQFVVEVLVNRETWGRGEGSSKKEATQEAGAAALNRWYSQTQT